MYLVAISENTLLSHICQSQARQYLTLLAHQFNKSVPDISNLHISARFPNFGHVHQPKICLFMKWPRQKPSFPPVGKWRLCEQVRAIKQTTLARNAKGSGPFGQDHRTHTHAEGPKGVRKNPHYEML